MHAKRITTSDKTNIYTYEYAEKILATLKPEKFSRKDLLMIILTAREQSIHGRILLMKELFLLYQIILKSETQDPKFVPYRLGPYSFHLAELFQTLNVNGIIEIKGRRNSKYESFQLTQKGRKKGNEIFKKLTKIKQQKIKERRKGWDQLGTDGILNYVYTHYPDYTDKSIIKNRYADVIWGR